MPMLWRFWQSEDGRRYLKEFSEGRPAESIAKELGCTADAVRDAHRIYLGKLPPRTRWKTEEGRRLLELLRNAPDEDSYRKALSEAIEATGLAEEAILRAYKLNIGDRPPGKPRRRPSFNEWINAHPQEAAERPPTTRTEALQDAFYDARVQGATQGAAPNERQPVVRIEFFQEFFQQGGRVTINGDDIGLTGQKVQIAERLDGSTPEMPVKALPAGGGSQKTDREVRSFGSDT